MDFNASSTQADTTRDERDTDDKLSISYEEEFEEIKCIGRGNFGAAFLVKLR